MDEDERGLEPGETGQVQSENNEAAGVENSDNFEAPPAKEQDEIKSEIESLQDEQEDATPSSVDEEVSSVSISEEEGGKEYIKKQSKPVDPRKIMGVIGVIVFLIVVVQLIPCQHEWVPATCESPKTCKKCEATEGEPLGHDWRKATCEEPRTCKRCGEQKGKSLGHVCGDWAVEKEASCSEMGIEKGTCLRCGEEVTQTIEKLPHTEGEWVITRPVSVASDGTLTPGTREMFCAVCGETISSETYTIEMTTSQKNAFRTALSYLDLMAFSYSGLIEQLEFEGYTTEDATFVVDNCGADWNEQAAEKAADYLDLMGFSRYGLIDQLMFEGFTYEQAVYGADAVGL